MREVSMKYTVSVPPLCLLAVYSACMNVYSLKPYEWCMRNKTKKPKISTSTQVQCLPHTKLIKEYVI